MTMILGAEKRGGKSQSDLHSFQSDSKQLHKHKVARKAPFNAVTPSIQGTEVGALPMGHAMPVGQE